jgi:CspA family cold shock protein
VARQASPFPGTNLECKRKTIALALESLRVHSFAVDRRLVDLNWAEEFALIRKSLPEQRNSTARDHRGHATFSERRVMTTGTVKWFNTQKGFGFIAPDGGGNDAFVHISSVERAGLNGLREGQKVSYELVSDRRTGKMSASELRALD